MHPIDLFYLPLLVATCRLLYLFVSTNNWKSPGKRIAVALTLILANNYALGIAVRYVRYSLDMHTNPYLSLAFQIPAAILLSYIFFVLRHGTEL